MYVYFIRAGHTGPIKIGVASNVDRRLDTLQTGNHMELFLVAKIKCQSKTHAYSIENALHKKFKGKRIRGEWFMPNIKISEIEEFNNVTKSNLDNPYCLRDSDRDLLLSSPL